MTDAAIRWPDRFAPANCPVHCINSLEMDVHADAVWAVLIRAVDWPSFYPNASNVVIEGGGPDLAAGARFTWKTFGVDLVTTVEEYVPGERIAWLAKGFAVEAYHAWLITPTATGCRVLTEETQHGLAAQAGKLLFPGRMERFHQLWLEGLAARAAGA